jgi:hypothetical protein
MKALNSFYILGTVGIAITGILQVFLGLILEVEGTLNSFMPLYMVWLTFLIIGTAQLLKPAKITKK